MRNSARVDPVAGLVRPTRIGDPAAGGITRGVARGPGWVQTTLGCYVPAGTDRTPPEQRILEQSMRLSDGAVTGWAALRLRGGRYFDGTAPDGLTTLPVPLVARGDRIREHDAIELLRERLPAPEVGVVRGIRCATAEAALFAEICRAGELREAVVAIDMACAAELTSLARFRAWLSRQARRPGLRLARQALALAVEDSWSPMETRLRLVWVLDLGWPAPLCNRRVYHVDGRLVGRPDLFDPVLGLAGEYDGAEHRTKDRHRRDLQRHELFRQAGVEPVGFGGGDLVDPAVVMARLTTARGRCGTVPPRWTLVLPRASGSSRSGSSATTGCRRAGPAPPRTDDPPMTHRWRTNVAPRLPGADSTTAVRH